MKIRIVHMRDKLMERDLSRSISGEARHRDIDYNRKEIEWSIHDMLYDPPSNRFTDELRRTLRTQE
jgi:hypothetical protein